MEIMKEQVDLCVARQVIKEAGIEDKDLCSEDVLNIYRAINNSVSEVTPENNSSKEVPEERNLNTFTDGVKTGDAAEASYFEETRKTHVNPVTINWKYIPLLCSDKYLKASKSDKVQILLEDFENSRKRRIELARRSFIRVPLPPPIDLLAINTDKKVPIFPKRVIPPRPMKRKNAMKNVTENLAKIDENSSVPNNILKSTSEAHTTSEENSWQGTESFEINDLDENDKKRYIKRKKRNETQESVYENVIPTVNSMNGKTNSENHENVPPFRDLHNDSCLKNQKMNKNVTFARDSKIEGESNVENKRKKNDAFDKDSVEKGGSMQVIKRGRHKLKPLTENNKNENKSKIAVRSVHHLQAGEDFIVEKQRSPTVTSDEFINVRRQVPVPTSPLLIDKLKRAKQQAELDKFQKSLNEITIDSHTSDKEGGTPESGSVFAGIETEVNRDEVEKQHSPTITPDKSINLTPRVRVPTTPSLIDKLKKAKQQAERDKFQKSLNETTIDSSDEEGGFPESGSVFAGIETEVNRDKVEKQWSPTVTPKKSVNSNPLMPLPRSRKRLIDAERGITKSNSFPSWIEIEVNKDEVNKTCSPPMGLLARGIPTNSCLFPRSPKGTPTRCEMLFDNLKKEDLRKEQEESMIDRFNKSLDRTKSPDIFCSSDEEGEILSDRSGSAKTSLNRNKGHTAARRKVKTVPVGVYESEPHASTSGKTDCPFCRKFFSLDIIQRHVSTCERVHTSIS